MKSIPHGFLSPLALLAFAMILGPVDSHLNHKAMAATAMMARKFLAVFS
jgi:hypothetical protein